MKSRENTLRAYLPNPKSPYVIRLDGKAFHTFTKGYKKPFDEYLNMFFDKTVEHLCSQIQSVKFGYHQSDEISLLCWANASPDAETWFGGNIQKIASVSSSICTAKFNSLGVGALAYFDSRVVQLENEEDVFNYFSWRQADAIRNSIQGLGQYHLPASVIHGVGVGGIIKLLKEIGIDWHADIPATQQMGSVCVKESFPSKSTFVRNGIEQTIDIQRTAWISQPSPVFDSDEGRNWIKEQFSN